MLNYVYLLKIREHVTSGEPIYKIGKTHRNFPQRYSNYPKGCDVILHVKCVNCDNIEKNIIVLFKKKYINRIDYGIEYFEGNGHSMCLDIVNLVNDDLKEIFSNGKKPMYICKPQPKPKKEPHIDFPKGKYICKNCYKIFDTLFLYKRHNSKKLSCARDNDKYKYSCEKCMYKCQKRCELNNHINKKGCKLYCKINQS